MKRRWHPTGFFGILAVLLALVSSAMAADKAEQLRRTMADIALLSSQLVQRRADASVIRDELATRHAALREEALKIVKEKQIDMPSKALEQPRLYYKE